MSYNPGYQSVLKDLKDSTRQRMIAIEFSYPAADVEERIVTSEAGIAPEQAAKLVRLGQAIRRIETGGRSEEHTSELQSLMRISYAVVCLIKKIQQERAQRDED